MHKMTRRYLYITALVLLLCGMFAPEKVEALGWPHNNVNSCSDCHGGGFEDAFYGFDPNCLSCHHVDGTDEKAKLLPFSMNDAANPFGTFTTPGGTQKQISHAWGVSYTNISAGAARGGRFISERATNLSCASCHYAHGSVHPKGLRIWTDTSAESLQRNGLCIQCHSARDVTQASVNVAPKTNSHPVNVQFTDVTAHNYPPLILDAYSSIESSVLRLFTTPGGDATVHCMTCHGVHYTDSNPYTNDTPAVFPNLSTGDGYLLRRYNDSTMCNDCHKYQGHQTMTCRNCHSPHNIGNNTKLIMQNISTPGVGGQAAQILPVLKPFTTSGFVTLTRDGTGICEVCHNLDNNSLAGDKFKNWSSSHYTAQRANGMANAPYINCMECHPHQEGIGTESFKGAGGCNDCHGTPPMNDYSGVDGYANNQETGVDYRAATSGYLNEANTPHNTHANVYPFGTQYGSGYASVCRACHDGSVGDHNDTPDQFQDVGFGLYSWGIGDGRNYNGGTRKCTDVYCHSNGGPWNGNYSTIQMTWSDSYTPTTCNSCHSYPPATNVHAKHTDAPYSFDCAYCHSGTVTNYSTISDTDNHVNREKDVIFGTLSGIDILGDFASSTYKCADTYCHGGDGAAGPMNDYTAVWNGSSDCGTCHNATTEEGATYDHTFSSHSTHVAMYDFTCDRCHDTLMNGDNIDVSKAGHVDGRKTVKFSSDVAPINNTGGSAPAGSPRTCQDIYCHSPGHLDATAGTYSTAFNKGTPEWPQWGTTKTCDYCHGNSTYGGYTAAMPNYETNSPKGNSHKEHVVDNDFGCNVCHSGTTADNISINDVSLHVNGFYNVSVIATYKTGDEGYVSGGTCDNIKCHGGQTTPNWGAGSISCTNCHYSTADVDNFVFGSFSGTAALINQAQYTSTGHGRYTGTTYYDYDVANAGAGKTCDKCHDSGVGHGDTSNPFRLYTSDSVALCDNCHGTDTELANWGIVALSNVTGVFHHASSTTDGRHDFVIKCIDCHDPHGDDNIFMIHSTLPQPETDNPGFDYEPSDQYGVVKSGVTMHNVDFSDNADGDDFASTSGSDNSTICNVCHTQTFKPATTLVRYRRDMTTGTGVDPHTTDRCTSCHKHSKGFEGAGCSSCHGNPPISDATLIAGSTNPIGTSSGSADAGAHEKHMSKKLICLNCHDSGGTMYPSAVQNSRIDIGFGALDYYTSGSYEGQNGLFYPYSSKGTAGGAMVCSNVKCHGSGTWLTAGGTDKMILPNWTSVVVCGNCHGAKKTKKQGDASWPDSGGRHAKHAGIVGTGYDIMCETCHDATLDNDTTLSDTHVNARSQVQFATGWANNSSLYTNDAVNDDNDDNCDRTYCHSRAHDTTVGNYSAPSESLAWRGGTASCNSCHGSNNYADYTAAVPDYESGSPKENSHIEHVVDQGINCSSCHYDTTTDGRTINNVTSHVNKQYDVVVPYDAGGNNSYDEVDHTCESVDCHNSSPAVWGSGSTPTCQTCHYSNSSDTDNFTFNNFSSPNTVAAKIYSSHWASSGHGLDSGSTYPVSGNNGAGLTCSSCHDGSKGHDQSAFRLLSTDTPDTLCLFCHGTVAQRKATWAFNVTTGFQSHTYGNLSTAGYDNLTTWHFTPKCVDCHDPHGDRNIFMIHSSVSHQGSDGQGRPENFPNLSAVVFNSVTGTNSYDDNTSAGRLCAVCHERTDHSGYKLSSHENHTLDCRTCHDHKQGFNPSGCSGCHNYPPPSGPKAPVIWNETSIALAGLHEPHAWNPRGRLGIPETSDDNQLPDDQTGFSCNKCHGDSTDGRSASHSNLSTAVMQQMTSLYGDWDDGGTQGYESVTDDSCTNVTCHGGRAYTRYWKKPADCDDCHGNRAAAGLTNITTGSHKMHTYSSAAGNAEGYNFACTQCHIDNQNNYSTHYDSNVDMGFNVAPYGHSTSTDYTRGTDFEPFTTGTGEWGTCSDVYCHGGKLDGGAQGSNITPVWGDPLTAGCKKCHNTTAPNISQGAHPKHVSDEGLACSYCHLSNTARSHVDGRVTFIGDTSLAGTTACASCHYEGATAAKADWNSATTQDCGDCHYIIGADLDDFTFLSITSTSKVTARINQAQYSSFGHGQFDVLCVHCHEPAASHNEAGNYFRLLTSNTNVLCGNCHGSGGVLGSITTQMGGKTGIFTHNSSNAQGNNDFELKCVDCHDPHGDNNIFMMHSTFALPNADNNYTPSDAFGIPTSTVWSNVDFTANDNGFDYATSVTEDNIQRMCNVCHTRTENPGDNTERFQRDMIGGNAEDSHNTDKKCVSCHSHSGGFKGIACDGCHGNPPTSQATLVGGSANFGEFSTSSVTAGKHAKHFTALGDTDVCSRCHGNGMSVTGDMATKAINIEFAPRAGYNIYTTGSYDGQSAVHTDGDYTGYVGDVPTTNTTYVCSTIKCHGDGGWLNGGAATMPNWTSVVVCGDCHAAKKVSGGGWLNATEFASNAHVKHADPATYDIMCQTCHKATLNNDTTLSLTHVNEQSQVFFDPADSRTDDGGSYSDGTYDVNGAFGSCSEIYCHSEGNRFSNYSAPNQPAPSWDAGAITCDYCHGNIAYNGITSYMPNYDDIGIGGPKANSHSEHVVTKGFMCNVCHQGTTTNNATINDESIHVNKFYNISVEATYATAGLESYSSVTDGTGGTCENIYCHGAVMGAGAVGNVPPQQTPTWGGTAPCGSCHLTGATTPVITQGGHQMHVDPANYNFACTKCHEPNTETTHVDGFKTFSGDVNLAATGTCANCHNYAGGSDAADAKFDWYSGTMTRSCGAAGSCHKGRADEENMPGKHVKHVSTTTGYSFQCIRCHSTTVSDDTTIADKSIHANGTENIIPGNYSSIDNSNGSYANSECSNIYCHSPGHIAATASNYSSGNILANWTSATVGCNYCHGGGYNGITSAMPDYANNQPKENSHIEHVVENGIMCNVCHSGTVNADNVSINDESLHVNGFWNVSVTDTFLSGSFTYNTGPKTCLEVSCHGGQTTPAWGAGSISCTNCHFSTGDVDDFVFGNFSGTAALINQTQYTSVGHGQVGIDKTCENCHDGSISHGDVANPFRLLTTADPVDDFCLYCHGSGSAIKGTWGFGNKTGYQSHTWENISTAGYDGGGSGKAGWDFIPKCVDCHDPHGDSNVAMIHTQINYSGSNAYGQPNGSMQDVNFATQNNWSSYVRDDGPPMTGICQRCHSSEVDFFDQNQFAAHNNGDKCTNCHDHKVAFKPPTNCNECHEYPPYFGDGKSYKGSAGLGKGAHEKHVDHLIAVKGTAALAPESDAFGDAKTMKICGDCHDLSTTANHMNGNDNRQMNISSTYQFGASLPGYNGDPSTTTTKNCSNVSCHYKTSPLWQNVTTAGD